MVEPFWKVRVGKDAITLVRTARRVLESEAFIAGFAIAFRALDRLDPTAYRLLVDLRLAIGRNDSAFERTVAEPRRRLLTTIPETGLLVATQVGAMQVRRHLVGDGMNLPVFTSEAEADRWLQRLDTATASAVAAASASATDER